VSKTVIKILHTCAEQLLSLSGNWHDILPVQDILSSNNFSCKSLWLDFKDLFEWCWSVLSRASLLQLAASQRQQKDCAGLKNKGRRISVQIWVRGLKIYKDYKCLPGGYYKEMRQFRVQSRFKLKFLSVFIMLWGCSVEVVNVPVS